jgi:glutathione S-transferase
MPSIEVPAHYGAVILCNVVAPAMLSMFVLAGKVMSARKEFSVAYPNLYGVPGVHKQADEFNKIQRGHQNMFESAIFYLPLSLMAGLEHPLAVAFGGLCYCVGSFAYQAGYTKTPNGRNQGLGPIKYIGFFTSLGVAIKMSISMI